MSDSYFSSPIRHSNHAIIGKRHRRIGLITHKERAKNIRGKIMIGNNLVFAKSVIPLLPSFLFIRPKFEVMLIHFYKTQSIIFLALIIFRLEIALI